jgi:hypothetical protein
MDAGHWNIDAVGEFDPAEFFGFIYEIMELATGRMYIGRKKFRIKNQNKRQQWQNYTGSCEPLNELIAEHGKDAFSFCIIRLCSGQCELTYSENEIQHARDVLRAKLPTGEKAYFNRAIGYKHYAGLEKQSEATRIKISRALLGNTNCAGHQNSLGHKMTDESRRRISEGNKGKVRTAEMRERYAASKRGIPKTVEHRQKLSEANIGKVRSDESKNKASETLSRLKWWNNGVFQVRTEERPPGDEWLPGRLLRKKP